ncbi:MAG: translocation/assembly module TamB domain-containing protein, partial [Comamonas sp.]
MLLPKAGGFALPSITVTPLSGAYAFTGNVAASPADILSGQAHFTTRNVASILPDGQASGALDAKASFTGTLNAPGITLAARLSDGTVVGVPAKLVTLDATAPQGGSGPIAFRFDGAPGKAALDAQLTLPGDGGARLDGITADLFGSKLAGDVIIGADGLATADLKSEHLNLKPLEPFTGLPLSGGGALALTATPSQGKQNAALTFTTSRLDVDLPTPITLDRVSLSAALGDLFGKADVDADFVATSGQAGLIHLDGVTAQAKGPLDKLALSVAAKGARETFAPDPFTLEADAIYAGAASSLTVSRLDLAVGKAGLALAKPLTIAFANGVEAKGFALALTAPAGEGDISGDFMLRKTVRLRFKAVDAPVDLASLLLPLEAIRGRMNGTAELDTGTNTAALSFRFDRVLLGQGATNERPPFDATLSGKWARGRFDLNAEAQGVSTRPFVLAASFPVNHPAGTAWPALAKRGAVSGNLTWSGPLASLAAFVDIGHQRIGGGTHVALAMRGDISAPQVSGEARIEDGFYENIDTGTTLKNITARLEGHESQSLGFTLDGTDGGEGKIAAQGRVSLAKGAFPAISISATFNNARLVRRSDVEATADGQIELVGPSFPPSRNAPLTIKGSVTTRALQIRIPESLPSSIAQIRVIEINGTSSKRATPADETPAIPIALDIKVATGMPARISGRGLDSLWNGELAVAGSVRRPRVSGRLDSERGTLDFAGKTFVLSKGLVRFPGSYPVDPDFEVTLAYARSDFKAAIDLTGRASAPQMRLSSTPTLPQDEILSRILFNKGVGELSAMEALQLARTLAELSGTNFGGGGLGVLDRLQESLSLDVLRIDSNAAGATTLSAGKYIQKGVYVGLEQGALASDSSVKVEIEVTPQISVDTR